MKDLHGEASRTVNAPAERCLELLEDVAGYTSWYPEVVRHIEVLDHDDDGRASRARATIHAAAGPIARDLDIVLRVEHRPGRVTLSRIANERSDPERFIVAWRVDQAEADRSRIHLGLEATLDVPRLVPLGGIGDTMANGFAAAAARAVEGG